MSGYEDNSVVTSAVNGLHNDLNGEAENVALKAGVSSVKKKKKKMPKISCEFPCRVSG